jgi:hypothetical protein
MIDNSEKWKDYPKRKHSVICAVNESHVGNEYRVYPLTKYNDILKKYNIPYFEDSKWGVCPDYDIWESFYHNPFFEHVEDLSEMNRIISQIYTSTKYNKLEQYNYNIFKSQLESVNYEDVQKLIDMSSDMNPLSSEILKILKYMIDNKLNLYEMFDYILDPVDNGFKVEIYSKLKNKYKFTNNEVWTDTPVLYINNRYLDDPDYDENDEE